MQNKLFDASFLKGGNAEWMDFDHPEFPADRFPCADLFRLHGGWGYMDFLHVPGTGYSVFNNKYHIKKRTHTFTRIDSESFELSFIIKNEGYVEINNVFKAHLQPLQYGMSYAPHTECKVLFNGRMVGETLDFHFTADYLNGLRLSFPEVLDPLMEAWYLKRYSVTSDFLPYMNKRLSTLVLKIRQMVNQQGGKTIIQPKTLDYNVMVMLIEVLKSITKLKWPKLTETQKLLFTDLDGNLLAHFGKANPSIEEVCSGIKMPAHYFSAIVREKFNLSAKSFLFEQRMKMGRMLLAGTSLNVASIAQKLGYRDITAFSRAFRFLYGISASAYRNNWDKRANCDKRHL